MTLRTGKGGRYRYYTCSIKARQGETGCKGRSIPMEKLDNLVAEHIADRLLQPERLEEILASVLDRRQERAERRREHIAELNKRAAETDLRLKRLYDAIEAGVADLDDPALKERIASLKAIRDQAQADAERAAAMLETSGQQAITPQMVQRFARTARERIRIDGGGYRRDHLRALAQRVEVADREVRIIGSKSESASDAHRRRGRKAGYARRSQFCSEVAEREGFEPSVPIRVQRFSRPPRSTAPAPLRAAAAYRPVPPKLANQRLANQSQNRSFRDRRSANADTSEARKKGLAARSSAMTEGTVG